MAPARHVETPRIENAAVGIDPGGRYRHRECALCDLGGSSARSIPRGFPDGNVNGTVSAIDLIDEISGMPLQAGTPVSIHPA